MGTSKAYQFPMKWNAAPPFFASLASEGWRGGRGRDHDPSFPSIVAFISAACGMPWPLPYLIKADGGCSFKSFSHRSTFELHYNSAVERIREDQVCRQEACNFGPSTNRSTY